MLGALLSLSNIFDVILWAIWKFLTVCFEALLAFADPLITWLVSTFPLPAGVGEATPLVLGWLQFGNYWLPIKECVALLILYWTFVSLFSAIKLTVKLIPTIG